jgi:hypothetical protein
VKCWCRGPEESVGATAYQYHGFASQESEAFVTGMILALPASPWGLAWGRCWGHGGSGWGLRRDRRFDALLVCGPARKAVGWAHSRLDLVLVGLVLPEGVVTVPIIVCDYRGGVGLLLAEVLFDG